MSLHCSTTPTMQFAQKDQHQFDLASIIQYSTTPTSNINLLTKIA